MKKNLLIFCFLMTGCNFAPKYESPDAPIPTAFRLGTDEKDGDSNIGWWKQLGDEVLDTYIEVALNNNKDLQVAMWRVSEYLAEYQVARSSLVPQITPSAGALKERLPINADFLQGRSPITPNYNLNLSLAYELDFWGVIRNTSRAAYAGYLAEIENRRTVVLTLVGSVAKCYILLRQLDLQLEIAKRILKSREDFVQIAKYRFEGGITSEIEVDQAASIYQEALAVVKLLEMKVEQEENLLSILLGQNPGELPRGKSLNDLKLPKCVIAGEPVELLTRRPDIMAKEQQLIAANANIGAARGAFFPQVNFSTLFGVDTLSFKNLLNKKSRTWEIGGSLLEQLFTGGRLSGQLKIAKAEKQELVFQYEQTILTALKEVNDSLIGFKKTKEVYAAQLGEVAALKDYLQLAWYRYYDGLTQYLTVLDAETRVFNTELNLARAEAEQYLNVVDLYKAVGGGWVVELDDHIEKINHKN
jgi:outer membrane protein, multidrug efflux system